MSGSGESTQRAKTKTAARAPSAAEQSNAKKVVLREQDVGGVASMMESLPDPVELDADQLVIMPAEISGSGRSFAKSILAMFGHTKTAPLAFRCTALVARGYVRVGAAEDLAFGYAPDSE